MESIESVRAELAESWAFDEAKTRLIFKLRHGVTFHDGKPFTAKDVVCTFDLVNGVTEGTRKARAGSGITMLRRSRPTMTIRCHFT